MAKRFRFLPFAHFRFRSPFFSSISIAPLILSYLAISSASCGAIYYAIFFSYFFSIFFILGCRKKRLLRCCWYREQHQQKEIDRPIVWSWHTIFYMDRELGLSRRTALQDIRVSFLEVFLSCPAPTVGARSRVALSVQRLQDPDALRTANPLRVRSGASKWEEVYNFVSNSFPTCSNRKEATKQTN